MRDLHLYFRPRLVEAWDEHGVGGVSIDDDLYLQWSAQPAGLQIECVSNRFLPPDRQLTFEQRRRLQEAGWQSPVGEDLPNYWQRFTDRSRLPEAVATLVGAVEILRLGISSPAPPPAVATPAPAERPPRPEPGRTTVVVPVYKAHRLAAWSVHALVSGRSGPVTVIDLLGLEDEESPEGRHVTGLGGGGLQGGAEVVIVRLRERSSDRLPAWLKVAAELLDAVTTATRKGREVVVVGPLLLSRHRWLYAGITAEVASSLVLCVEDDTGGLAAEAACQVLDAAPSAASVVLLGEHAQGSEPLVARADAALNVQVWGGDRHGAPLEAAALVRLLEGGPLRGGEPDAPAAAARTAPMWARFMTLMSGRVPPEDQESAALALLEDCIARLKEERANLLGELVLPLLGGMVVRLDYWVSPSSVGGVRRVLAAADALESLGSEVVDLAEQLRRRYGQAGSESLDRSGPRHEGSGKHEAAVHEALEDELHYVPGGTVCTSKSAFAAILAQWLGHEDREAVIGRPSSYGGKPLIHVQLGARRFHLNGDSRDEGVQRYLDLVHEHGPDLPWHVVANRAGKLNKVAFGQPPQPLRYFYLYADDEAAEPYSV